MNIPNFAVGGCVNLTFLNEDQLLEVAVWCKTRASELEWTRIVAEGAKRDAKWKRERELAEAKENALVAKLKNVIKPGMRLKMKGCKDAEGIREFIKWEGNNLVCWQIKRRISYVGGDSRQPRREEWNTNIVTNHMPNKVQEIYVDGTALKIKSILQ